MSDTHTHDTHLRSANVSDVALHFGKWCGHIANARMHWSRCGSLLITITRITLSIWMRLRNVMLLFWIWGIWNVWRARIWQLRIVLTLGIACCRAWRRHKSSTKWHGGRWRLCTSIRHCRRWWIAATEWYCRRWWIASTKWCCPRWRIASTSRCGRWRKIASAKWHWGRTTGPKSWICWIGRWVCIWKRWHSRALQQKKHSNILVMWVEMCERNRLNAL